MKFSDLKGWIETFLLITTVVSAALSRWVTDQAIKITSYVVLILAIVIFLVYKGVSIYREKRTLKQAMSNNSVIKSSEKHCKTLYKYAKANEKKLLKDKKINKMRISRKKEDKILEKLKGINVSEKKKAKTKKKLEKLAITFKDVDAISLLKSLEHDQDYQVSQLLSSTFIRLERILLNAEQFHLRIKFGNYINTFSSDTEHRIKAKIDFIGWTYMMMGEVSKGERAITTGIKKAKKALTEVDNEKAKQKLYLLITRGYRHLGSARPTTEKHPEKALRYLKEANKYLELVTTSNEKEEKAKQEMQVGITYGIIAANFFYFKNKSKAINLTDNDYLRFYNNYLQIDDQLKVSKTYANKHRYIKYELMNAKYLEKFIKFYNAFDNHIDNFNVNSSDFKKEIKNSLLQVEGIFKNNIFMDEAVEQYLEENINCLKHELINLLERSI